MNLHPIMAQALKPWMPMPTLAELDEQRMQTRREELIDEYRSGLDSIDDEDDVNPDAPDGEGDGDE